MRKISYFRQQRYDDGIRTGIAVNEMAVLERFVPGDSESDPALLWYVDVRLEGELLPDDPDAVRDWLSANGNFIKDALNAAADHIQIGLDADDWPFIKEIENAPPGIVGCIAVSGIRGLAEGELSENVRDTAEQWESSLAAMESLANV